MSAANPRRNKNGEVIIKSGVLFKRGSGGGLLKRKNWKPRYFELTQHALRYFTVQDGELKGDINLKMCGEDTLEIMPADSMKTGGSASTIWRIAVNTPGRRLLVAAGTEHEMNDWVDALLDVFRANTTGSGGAGRPSQMQKLPPQQQHAAVAVPPRSSIASKSHFRPSDYSDNDSSSDTDDGRHSHASSGSRHSTVSASSKQQQQHIADRFIIALPPHRRVAGDSGSRTAPTKPPSLAAKTDSFETHGEYAF
ncbi:hypothetical protein DYB28_008296 [Aphanomyces astaci]|uniref:PH domain-containing protein n=1 Tax=Aphanomyces astaci TaxID=112090 RepID=A0A9X8E065_APHAT|nr:hypothetical protein DYB28_008296 [Aphanomyces astaci]